jgi:hypothetical protein
MVDLLDLRRRVIGAKAEYLDVNAKDDAEC